MNLHTEVHHLQSVGERRAKALLRLGIATVGDLLAHLPRAYEDWSRTFAIADAPAHSPCCVRATVQQDPTAHVVRPGMTLFKTMASDASSVMQITLFNSEWLAGRLHAGQTYLFFGRITQDYDGFAMNSPQFDAPTEARLKPIYPLTEGISSGYLAGLVEQAFARLPPVQEILPAAALELYGLLPRMAALRAIHRPDSMEQAAAARRRLAFNELLTLQLCLRLLRHAHDAQPALPLNPVHCTHFAAGLPFALTGAQARAIAEAAADLAKTTPMQRLLQGDVGSGKTAVAAALLHAAVQCDAQAALLAPTELLARQHQTSLQAFGLPAELLVAPTPSAEKKRMKAQLASGELPLVVGTHALLQSDVAFARLALVVVDEQHRFGVHQRQQLQAKQALAPHVFVMSATPIPRSLALVLFADLAVSVLDERPPGRQPVATYAVPSALRARAFGYIQKHLDAGQQGYIVCARTHDSPKSELAAAERYFADLQQGAFASYRLGLLHGKLPPKQKEDVMRRFAAGEVQLLVATTVVEVGVDVPNATILLIENAEQFGLSQLHQLRGRVGRGALPSTCILVSDAHNDDAKARLAALRATNDGFAIAQADLELRGPGDFLGANQHGLPPLRIADLAADTELLAQTRAFCLALLADDPTLAKPEHSALRLRAQGALTGATLV